jgi:hypothetical protein
MRPFASGNLTFPSGSASTMFSRFVRISAISAAPSDRRSIRCSTAASAISCLPVKRLS